MLTGRLPFPIKRGIKLNTKLYERGIDFPSILSKEAKDLIQKLLIYQPKKKINSYTSFKTSLVSGYRFQYII